jgi:HAD superfamily hydrolase (TIGR01509 family)
MVACNYKARYSERMMIDWQHCDTILLDMDGTVLDLAFDNYFWRELVPRCYARAQRRSQAEARDEIYARYAGVQGRLEWYCLDHWTAELGLDLKSLKAASSQRIRFLPGAREFLVAAARSGKRLVLVTNAHGDTLDVKKGVAGLDRYFERFVTSHAVGFAKEQDEFWTRLESDLDLDRSRTLFVDDSEPVLDAAARFGIGEIVAVTRPDTRLPLKESGTHRGVPGVINLL